MKPNNLLCAFGVGRSKAEAVIEALGLRVTHE